MAKESEFFNRSCPIELMVSRQHKLSDDNVDAVFKGKLVLERANGPSRDERARS